MLEPWFESVRKHAALNKRLALEAAQRESLSDEATGCYAFRGSIPEHFEPTASVTDLTTRAKAIVSGEVTAMRQGFLGGLPGSLLRISPDYTAGERTAETFLFYPYARIKTARFFP